MCVREREQREGLRNEKLFDAKKESFEGKSMSCFAWIRLVPFANLLTHKKETKKKINRRTQLQKEFNELAIYTSS